MTPDGQAVTPSSETFIAARRTRPELGLES